MGSGKANLNTDALSRSPQAPTPEEGIAQSDVQVSVVDSERANIEDLLETPPASDSLPDYQQEQQKDPRLLQIIHFLEKKDLPPEEELARMTSLESPLFTIVDGVLYFVDPKQKGC